jgi:hypothetical protein
VTVSNNNESRYIIYKQISHSYFYILNNEKQTQIKKYMFNNINQLYTDFISKIKTGGDKSFIDYDVYKLANYEINNLKEFNKIIPIYKKMGMDYYKIRLDSSTHYIELFENYQSKYICYQLDWIIQQLSSHYSYPFIKCFGTGGKEFFNNFILKFYTIYNILKFQNKIILNMLYYNVYI